MPPKKTPVKTVKDATPKSVPIIPAVDMRAMNALFQMCSDLKAEVESLKAVVKALVESNNKKSVAVKEVVENMLKSCSLNREQLHNNVTCYKMI